MKEILELLKKMQNADVDKLSARVSLSFELDLKYFFINIQIGRYTKRLAFKLSDLKQDVDPVGLLKQRLKEEVELILDAPRTN